MSSIRVEISDWLFNAGLVGLANILDESDIPYVTDINYIEFDESVLDNFEEKYFNYFIKKYEKFTSWYKITNFEDYINNLDMDKLTDQDLDKINNKIDEVKKKLTSNSYKSAYLLIKNDELNLALEEKRLIKIKKGEKQNIDGVSDKIIEQLNVLTRVIRYLRKVEVKRIIVAKNIIYDVIQEFWSDVSFLNKNNSKNDMYEEYKSYFIEPARAYASVNQDKLKYDCFSCSSKVSKLSKPDAFDLTWLNKIGVDIMRKSSHFWNFNSDSYICPLCNLIYSCVPAGFTVIKGKGLFINQNSNMRVLIGINKTSLNHNTTFEELEQASYFFIAESVSQNQIEQFSKEIENIQVIKYDSQNERKPYSFNLLSRDKLKVIYSNKNRLKSLIKAYVKLGKDYYISLYSEVVQRLFNNSNQFDLINLLLHLNLQEKYNNLRNIYMIIKINNDSIGGRNKYKMLYYKKIDDFKDFGVKMRDAYTDKNAKNKLPGITYRLLNSLKTKDVSKFMETLINSYMYLNKQIPISFVDGLKDIDKFQTIGYSFLIGLQGDDSKEGKEDKANTNNVEDGAING